MSSKRSGKELQNKNIEQLDPGLSTCLNLRSRLEQGQAAFPPSSKSALRLTGLQTTICPLLGPGGCLTLHRQRMKAVPFGRLSVLGLGFHGKMVMGKWLALVLPGIRRHPPGALSQDSGLAAWGCSDVLGCPETADGGCGRARMAAGGRGAVCPLARPP